MASVFNLLVQILEWEPDEYSARIPKVIKVITFSNIFSLIVTPVFSPQLSLLEDAGFGGVLLYVDPCDLPKTADLADKAFMVSLNSGGDPSTPGYASIGKYCLRHIQLMDILIVHRF